MSDHAQSSEADAASGRRTQRRTDFEISTESAQHRRQMERALALMFGAGGTLATVSSLLPNGPEVNTTATLITSLLGFPTAALLLLGRGRLPTWVLHVVLAVGGLITSVGVYFGGGGPNGTAGASFYVWVSVYSFYFFRWRPAFIHMALIATSYAAVLAIQTGKAGMAEWVLIMGTNIVAGTVVGRLARQVRALAREDSLTGLPNRRAWEDLLPREMARAQRNEAFLCIAVLDLDHFKALNDTSGHHAGDLLLQRAARAWRAELRAGDIIARLGGDEFVAVLPNCPIASAERLIRRCADAMPGDATFSSGVAQWTGQETAKEFMDRADQALYRAKRQGRGRVGIAQVPGDETTAPVIPFVPRAPNAE